VTARNGDVIKENVAFGVTADRDNYGVLRPEDKPGAGVWPAGHHEHSPARRHAVEQVARFEQERLRRTLAWQQHNGR
jgi:hypothetical protein